MDKIEHDEAWLKDWEERVKKIIKRNTHNNKKFGDISIPIVPLQKLIKEFYEAQKNRMADNEILKL